MNTATLFSNLTSTVSSIDQMSAKSDVVTNTDEMQGRKRSALMQALALRCSDSDDSSADETESNHSTTTTASDEEDDDNEEFQIEIHNFDSSPEDNNKARFPSTFGRNQHERHFSNISEKKVFKNQNESSKRTAQKLHGRHRPAPMELASSTHATITPSIEIEQVFDDEDVQLTESTKRPQQTDARLAARTKMMQAIGKNRLASLRRSESLDVLIGQPDEKLLTPKVAEAEKTPSPSTSINLATTPLPRTPGTAALRTPGTAYHHRSFSCPTPNSPMLHQFGQLQVVVTPPTPRPQGSPIIGVFIKGVHDRQSGSSNSSSHSPSSGRQHFCAFDDQCHRLGRCRKELKLAVPEFELAPGRTKLLETQRIQAMAIMAWKQQEELMLDWNSMKNGSKKSATLFGFSSPNKIQFSPVLLPGTPCAPSLTHVQEVRAMQSRHVARRELMANHKPLPSTPNSAMTISTTNATDGGDGQRSTDVSPSTDSLSSSSSSSWWREPRSAPLSWNGSSASAYSQASAMSNNMNNTSPVDNLSSDSNSSAFGMVATLRKDRADVSSNWRSKDEVKSVEPRSANNGLSRSKHPYVPPAMRNSNQLKGRKEGTLATIKLSTATATSTLRSRENVGRKFEENVVRSNAAPSVRTLIVPSTTTNESLINNNSSIRQHAAKSMLSKLSNRTSTPISPQA